MRCDKRHMLLYAVTDRAWTGKQTLYQQVEAALQGGVTCVQLREKNLGEADFLQEDMAAGEVRRRVGGDMILGVSVHTVEEARQAVRNGADYLGLGAVFPTGTKTDADVMPGDMLRAICGAVDVPTVAIGGLNRSNILQLSGSGVDGAALVSAIFGAEDIEGVCRELRALAEEMVGL